jgi:hypothetical protein
MINNHNVVHQVNLLAPIELNLVRHIIPRFVGLDEWPINEPNATLEFWYCGAQHSPFLYCVPSNLIPNGIITNRTF